MDDRPWSRTRDTRMLCQEMQALQRKRAVMVERCQVEDQIRLSDRPSGPVEGGPNPGESGGGLGR